MALKAVVDKIDEIPEALRAEYTEKDGKFHLIVDGLEDASGLKKSLEILRKENKKFESDLKEQKKVWEKLGKTPDEIEQLIEQANQMEQDRLERAGEWDKLKAQMNDKHEKDLKEIRDKLAGKDGEISTLRTNLQSQFVDVQATAAIASAKGEPILLLPVVQRFTKVVEEGGKFTVRVVDEKGNQRVDGKGEPLTIASLVEELKQDQIYGRAFEASGNSGSGMRPNGGPGGSGSSIQRRGDLKTEKDRAAFINEYGLKAYQDLPL